MAYVETFSRLFRMKCMRTTSRTRIQDCECLPFQISSYRVLRLSMLLFFFHLKLLLFSFISSNYSLFYSRYLCAASKTIQQKEENECICKGNWLANKFNVNFQPTPPPPTPKKREKEKKDQINKSQNQKIRWVLACSGAYKCIRHFDEWRAEKWKSLQKVEREKQQRKEIYNISMQTLLLQHQLHAQPWQQHVN